jgi:hypothetical protein
VGYSIRYLVSTGFLLLALWLMVKIQKFQYNFPGLLGSAALAGGLDMIPYVGHYLALPTLYLCLMKVTREDMTGVVFTAGISYALVFVMNLFLLGSLMGDLRPSFLQAREAAPIAKEATEEGETDTETNRSIAPRQSVNPAQSASASTTPDKAVAAPQPSLTPAGLTLKGIIKSSKNPMAMISSGGKTYTIAMGESIPLQGADKNAKATLETVEDSSVVVSIAGEKVVLKR